MRNNVAFIGPETIHRAFSQMDRNWDFQSPIETLDEFKKVVYEGDDSKIAADTSMFILLSRLFQGEDQQAFAEIVALLAPYAAVLILHQENEENSEEIKDLMTHMIKANLQSLEDDDPDGVYKSETPFYFVDYNKPQESMNEALARYVRDPLANDEARVNILASMPDNVARILQAENEDSSSIYEQEEEEDVIIPDKDAEGTGRVIAVTSSKGGSGKSTVSMMLGAYIAKGSQIAYQEGKESRPLKVCIVDLDVRDGQLGFLNGSQSPTIVDILMTGAVTPDNIQNGLFRSEPMGCDFIFAAKRPRNASQIPIEFYVELIHNLRSMYDYVILDTSVNYRDPLLEHVAYPMADKIIFVTDMGISSIFGMARWIQETTRIDDNKDPISPDKIGIVVNKVMKDVNMGIEKIEKLAKGRPILAMFPSVPTLITYAANTYSLEQVLNYPQINIMAKTLADSIVEPTGYQLSEVPARTD